MMPLSLEKIALARHGAERERLEALSRRVSIDRACRDPARRGPGESAVSSGDVRLIERDTLLAGGVCCHLIVTRLVR